MEFRQFEREFLRLAFTSSVELTPVSLAFFANVSVREAEKHMHTLVAEGVLELHVDDDGRLTYEMPDRPSEPVPLSDPALLGSGVSVPVPALAGASEPPRAIVVRGSMEPARWEQGQLSSGQAVASMFLNAMICPGLGSLVGGRTGTGVAQLSLFLIGLPLVVIKIGLPLMLAAWVWGIATGAQMIAEARD